MIRNLFNESYKCKCILNEVNIKGVCTVCGCVHDISAHIHKCAFCLSGKKMSSSHLKTNALGSFHTVNLVKNKQTCL